MRGQQYFEKGVVVSRCQDSILLKEVSTRKVGKYEQPPCRSNTLTNNKIIMNSNKHPRTGSNPVRSHAGCVFWTYADGDTRNVLVA